MSAEIIGYFTQSVLNTLQLSNVKNNTPILLGSSNVEHIKKRHPYEYSKYFDQIPDIISAPDYVGINPDHSISFVKEFCINSEYVKVAVRISTNGVFFAKSLYILNTCNAKRYISKGTLKRLDKSI